MIHLDKIQINEYANVFITPTQLILTSQDSKDFIAKELF